MRDRAAVIITHNNCVLLLWRRKDGHSYYSIPGGKLKKKDPSPAHGAAREIQEETGLIPEDLIELEHIENEDRTEYYFLPGQIKGDLDDVRFQGDELFKAHPQNQYHLEWVPFGRLHRTRLQPPPIRALLLGLLQR